jgi:uncharacterized lipoprotein YddW (UPF0748 family)
VFATSSFTGREVISMAGTLAQQIADDGSKVPESITISESGKTVSIENSLYLMAKFLSLYGANGEKVGAVPSSVSCIDVRTPLRQIAGEQGGKVNWDDIYTLSRNIVVILEKDPTIPSQFKFRKNGEEDAYMSPDVLIYVIARAINWINDNASMPNYSSIRPVTSPANWPIAEKAEVKIEKVPAKPGEIKAIWVHYDSLDAYGVDKGLQEIKDMGFTDIFLLVKGISGKVCWPSRLTYSYYSNTNILAQTVAFCKRNNIRIHAWFVVNQDKAYLSEHPDSRMYGIPGTRNGDFQRVGNTVDFVTDTLYRNYVISLMKEVVENYDVDGIHLDYIRYPTGSWGWGPYQLGRALMNSEDVNFLLDNAIKTWGDSGDGSTFIDMYEEFKYADVNEWVQARMEDVRKLVDEIRTAVKSVKSDVVLSAALMPEGGDTDFKNNAFAMVHYGQRYADFGELCDMMVPMTYHMEFGKKASWLVDVYNGTRDVTDEGHKIVMGIQGYDITPSEMQKAIYATRTAGADGFAVFSFDTVFKNEGLKDALKEAM